MSKRAIANVAAIVLLLLLAVRQFGGSLPDILPVPIAISKPGSWVVIVEESEDRLPEVAKILADASWLASLTARQAKFRVYDDDTQSAQPYVQAAGATRPAVLIIAPDGSLLGVSGDVTRPAIDAFLREKAGL